MCDYRAMSSRSFAELLMEVKRIKSKKTKHDVSEQTLPLPDLSLSSTITTKEKSEGVVLLFLIIDSLPFEDIWRCWVCKEVSVFIHAKYPDRVTSSWVKRHLIRSHLTPAWGSIEIVEAELLLLENALRTTNANMFCFVSESCIPVTTVERVLDVSYSIEKSILNLRTEPENGYAESVQFMPLESSGIPRNNIGKSDQWCVLTRHDAKAITYVSKDLLPFFNKVKCSDEMFFATTLLMLKRPITEASTTYTLWLDSCDKSPQYLNPRQIVDVVTSGCFLFARKLARTCYEEVRDILTTSNVITNRR